jgi:hypothetical protein
MKTPGISKIIVFVIFALLSAMITSCKKDAQKPDPEPDLLYFDEFTAYFLADWQVESVFLEDSNITSEFEGLVISIKSYTWQGKDNQYSFSYQVNKPNDIIPLNGKLTLSPNSNDNCRDDQLYFLLGIDIVSKKSIGKYKWKTFNNK